MLDAPKAPEGQEAAFTPRSSASPDQYAEALIESEARALAESPLRRPSATYRLQLHKGFGFREAAAVVDYLADLGITDLYLSPYLTARPGSTHGYDVFDHGRINPEIGDEDAHSRLVAILAKRGMGRVLDIVPNHMGIQGPNRFWLDVLEVGPRSPSARFFDIDWNPVKEELEGKVLLPVLEDQYGRVLESGNLVLERRGGELFIRYHDERLPLAPQSYARVLECRAEELPGLFGPEDPELQEYRSIWASSENLPERSAADPESVEQILRERDVIKRRIDRLCDESERVRTFLDGNVALFRGVPGDPTSFDLLHRLLEEQVYRLAYWRVAAEEINYRRFFDINDLAGLRVEDPTVFDVVHATVFRFIDEGGVTGLRIDHPDGLADPIGYLYRLQEELFLRACRRRIEAEGEVEWRHVAGAIRRRYRETIEADPSSPLARRMPVLIEKILSRGEDLPHPLPIDGTVGYEYLNALNGLFVDQSGSEAIEAAYKEFTGDDKPFAELLYESKEHITRWALASEVNMLARQLNRVSERDRRSRDFTLNELRRAVREVISCFPVYRSYVRAERPVSGRDRAHIEQAVARARGRNPSIDASVFAFLKDVLLGDDPPGASAEDRAMRVAFVTRFQQTTGPVQAKGLEDTAFYRQAPLASLNEVGGDPSRFGGSPSAFHGLNSERLSRWTGALDTTATHDTKRGEDARIRIDVLSELADEWRTHLARWSRCNTRKKAEVFDKAVPDAREEYLFYQALIGVWPFGGPDDAAPEGLADRLSQYILKAAREAKLNTSWTDPDPSYADALARFVHEVLDAPDSAVFLRDFIAFQRKVSRIGVVHSLSQALLKLASPGVPDVYQGCELWDLNLVDPDNRRPVDYRARIDGLNRLRERLARGETRADLAASLLAHPDDGAIKQYLIWTGLLHRRDNLKLYQNGNYRQIDADGPRRSNVLAFLRHHAGESVLVAAPRLISGLMGEDARDNPIGAGAWGETRLVLPDSGTPRRWRDLLTDRVVETRDLDGHPVLDLAVVYQILPTALLVGEGGAE